MGKKRGFTLIEVLIVTMIIGIFTIMALVFILPSLNKGRDGRRKADLHRIANALEEYYNNNNFYPTYDQLNPPNTACGYNTILSSVLKDVPCDPITKEPYHYLPDPFSCDNVSVMCNKYRLFTELYVKTDPDIEKLGSAISISGSSEKGFYRDENGAGKVYNYGIAVGRRVDGGPITGP